MGRLGTRWNDRRYTIAVASIFAILVFAGFSRTFYLHTLFAMPAPSAFLQFHGAVFTGWIVLLVVQSLLIAKRRVTWHRNLGYAGAAYATLIIPVGAIATLGAAEREVRAHSAIVPQQLNVLGLELTQLFLFACLVGAAVWFRNRAAYHKRLMIMATLCILPNAIVRLTLLSGLTFLFSNLIILSMWALFAIAIVAFDAIRIRKLHRAFAWSVPIAISALYIAWAVSNSAPWDRFWTFVLA